MVAKADGEKLRFMSESEKASYAEKDSKKKAEYEKALQEFTNNRVTLKGNGTKATLAAVEKSVSEVRDNDEDEASS